MNVAENTMTVVKQAKPKGRTERWVYAGEREDTTPGIRLWRWATRRNLMGGIERFKTPRVIVRHVLHDTSRYPAGKPLNKARERARNLEHRA